MELEWIVFDVMGVIFEVGDDTNELLVPFVQQRNPGISRTAINEIYLSASLGNISSARFWEAVGLEEGYPEIESHYLDSCLSLDPQFVAVAEKLGHTYSIGVLSNDLKEWSSYLRRKYTLERLFSRVIIGGDVGLRKPDPRIYVEFLKGVSGEASSCVFIDDRLNNLEAASEQGMRTIWLAREEMQSPFQPDGIIHALAELPELVATL